MSTTINTELRPGINSSDIKPDGRLTSDIKDLADIPPESFPFDYHDYVKSYEESKEETRGPLLEEIHNRFKELAASCGTPEYDRLKGEFDTFVDPINHQWGAEFDNDIISLIQAILVLHKDITFVLNNNAELFWYDRLIHEIEGDPSQMAWDEDDQLYQSFPGRPDKDSIKLRILRLPALAKE